MGRDGIGRYCRHWRRSLRVCGFCCGICEANNICSDTNHAATAAAAILAGGSYEAAFNTMIGRHQPKCKLCEASNPLSSRNGCGRSETDWPFCAS